MADNLRTLGLSVDASGAIKPLADMKAGLEDVASASDEVVAASKRVTDAAKQQAASTAFVWQAEAELLAVMNKVSPSLTAAAAGAETVAQAQRRWLQEDGLLFQSRQAFLANERKVEQQLANETTTYNTLIAKEKELADATARVTDSTRSVGLAHARAIELDAAGVDGKGQLIKATDGASVSTTRLLGPLRTLTDQAIGANRATGTLVSVLAQMGLGSTVTVGLLAGVAAISVAYEILNARQAEHKKAVEESTKSVLELYRVSQQGLGGKLALDIKNVNEELKTLTERASLASRASAALLKASTVIGGASGAILGLAGSALGAYGADRQKSADEVRKAKAEATIKDTQEILDGQNKRHVARLEALAVLIKDDKASADQRAYAIATVKKDQSELARLAQDSQSSDKQASLNAPQISRLKSEISALDSALNPASLKVADERLTAVTAQVNALTEAAGKFGKDDSINAGTLRMLTSLTALEKKYPDVTAAVEALKKQTIAAGEATKAGLLAQTAKDLDDQYTAAKALYDETRTGTTATLELNAAKAAQVEIDAKSKALGVTLSDTLQQQIRDTKQLGALTAEANTTNTIVERARALQGETAAIKSGASARQNYAADVQYTVDLAKALLITDDATRQARVAAITDLHNEALAHTAVTAAQKAGETIAEAQAALDVLKQTGVAQKAVSDELYRQKEFNIGKNTLGLDPVLAAQFADQMLRIHQQTTAITNASKEWKGELRGMLEIVGAVASALSEAGSAFARSLSQAVGAAQNIAGAIAQKHANDAESARTGTATSALASAGVYGQIAAGILSLGNAIGHLLDNSAKIQQRADDLSNAYDKQYAAMQKLVQASTDSAAAITHDANARRAALADVLKNELNAAKGDETKGRAAFDQYRAGLDALSNDITQRAKDIAALAAELQHDRDSLAVRNLRASGDTSGADLLALTQQQADEAKAAHDKYQSAAYDAALAATQLAEKTKFLADAQLAASQKAADAAKVIADAADAANQKAAAAAESERRNVTSNNLSTLSFSDPRGAAFAAFSNDLSNKYIDALARNASAAELASIALNNLAASADYLKKQQEADTRQTEGLVSRILGTLGNDRATQDYTRGAQQRQETVGAAGSSPFNIGLTEFTHQVENSFVQMTRNIEDGTKAIRANAANAIAANNVLIDVIKTQSAADIKAVDDQIKSETIRFDGLITAAQAQVGYAQQAVQTAQANLALQQRAVDALATLNDSLKLSDLSTLSPSEKLAETKRQYDALVAAARGGDANAAGNLAAAANAFLAQDKLVNGTTTKYGADFAGVQSVVDELSKLFGGSLNSANRGVDASTAGLIAAQSSLQTLQDLKSVTLQGLNDRKTQLSADAAASIQALQDSNQKITDSIQPQLDALAANEQKLHDDRVALLSGFSDFSTFLQGIATSPMFNPTTIVNVSVAPSQGAQEDNANLKAMVTSLATAVKELGVQSGLQSAGFTILRDKLIDVATAINTTGKRTRNAVLAI